MHVINETLNAHIEHLRRIEDRVVKITHFLYGATPEKEGEKNEPLSSGMIGATMDQLAVQARTLDAIDNRLLSLMEMLSPSSTQSATEAIYGDNSPSIRAFR